MRRTLAAILLGAALLAACGGDDRDEGRSFTIKAEAPLLRVVGDEYFFDPKQVIVTRASGPVSLRIELDNRGTLAHNLKVLAGERELGGTPTFAGGEARSGTVRLRAGRYRMVCTVGNHAQLGMTGTLEVR
jgi:plastocyanin